MTTEETRLEIQNGELRNNFFNCCLFLVLKWLNSETSFDQEKLQNLFIENADFDRALKIVHPSSKREGFATVPDVSWDNIGALREVRFFYYFTIITNNESNLFIEILTYNKTIK